MGNAKFDDMLESMKKVAAVLRDAGVPFALGGGLAAWARGGIAGDHDVDFMIREDDMDRAVEAVEAAGMRIERPPEGWLVKAWDGDVMVDLIFRPAGLEITGEVLDSAEELNVHAMPMPVLSANDILTTKLMALSEHSLDYEGVLEISRPLREQVDWEELRKRTSESPYARAYFTLAEGLGICPA